MLQLITLFFAAVKFLKALNTKYIPAIKLFLSFFNNKKADKPKNTIKQEPQVIGIDKVPAATASPPNIPIKQAPKINQVHSQASEEVQKIRKRLAKEREDAVKQEADWRKQDLEKEARLQEVHEEWARKHPEAKRDF